MNFSKKEKYKKNSFPPKEVKQIWRGHPMLLFRNLITVQMDFEVNTL